MLDYDLDIVFCGTAAGPTSAEHESYYAGPGNRFWDILHDAGFVDELLDPEDYELIEEYSLGLTDVVKEEYGSDDDLSDDAFDVDGFVEKIEEYEPEYVAFNGKRAAKEVFDTDDIDYGEYEEMIGSSDVYVLPSTSGAARRWWDEDIWHDLADEI